MNEKIVAILDDGVNEKWCHFHLYKDLEVSELKIIKREDADSSKESHGSICANIIHDYVPDCSIISIKVLDSNLHRGGIEDLISALNWCRENNIRLINLSLGTYSYADYHLLRPAINELSAAGCWIISAYGRDCYSSPAGIAGVLGVKADKRYTGFQFSASSKIYGPMFFASSTHRLPDNRVAKHANSYAAPVVTSLIANKYLDREHDIFSLSEVFQSEGGSTEYWDNYRFRNRLDFVNQAVIVGDSSDILKEHVIFQVCTYLDDFVNAGQIPYEKFSLLFIPPEVITKQWLAAAACMICKNNNSITGVAVCGNLSKDDKKYLFDLNNKYFWCEEAYGCNVEKKAESYIIFADLPNLSCLSAFVKLMRVMQMDYNILVLSDITNTCLYGWEYIDTSKNIEKQVLYYESIYDYNLLIIVRNSMNRISHDKIVLSIYDNTHTGVLGLDTLQNENDTEYYVKQICDWVNSLPD